MKLLNTLLLSALLNLTAQATPMEGDVKFTPSDNKTLAIVYTYDEKIDDKFNNFVKKDLEKKGFFLNDPHHNVNIVYEQNFGTTVLDTLNFNSLFADALVRPLINKDPRIAAFSPFNILMYRTKANMGETVVAHLTPEAMLDILEISDPEVRATFIKGITPLDAEITSALGGKKTTVAIKGYAKDTMMNIEIPFEEPEDIDDYLDEFQEKFEATFQEKGYIIAGYYNVKDSFNSEEDILEDYTMFWSYDLCHIPFSYKIFDGENAKPLAGMFAPCSMYVYVREGENKIVIGMPTLNAWGAALGITNKGQLEMMDNLDKEITEILKSFGGIEVPNGNPLLRK